MAKLPSLDKIEAEIKETSDKIESLVSHIHGLEENLALLKNLEKQFEQNISVLKDNMIISVASEYKKVRMDLKTVSGRIGVTFTDLKNSRVFMERAETLLVDLKVKRGIILENQNAKVLIGYFGKK